jgi:hypothetical protein
MFSKGNQMEYYNWNEVENYWNLEESLWNEAVPILKSLAIRHAGIAEPQIPDWQKKEFEKLQKAEQRKIIRLILYYNKIKYSQEIEIDEKDYNVTAKDIQMIIEEYEKRKSLIEKTTILVDNIRLD